MAAAARMPRHELGSAWLAGELTDSRRAAGSSSGVDDVARRRAAATAAAAERDEAPFGLTPRELQVLA